MIWAQTGTEEIWTTLAEYGLLGMIVFVLGLLAWGYIKREREEKVFWRDAYLELNTKVTDKYVPSLEANTESNRQVVLLLHDLERDRKLRR